MRAMRYESKIKNASYRISKVWEARVFICESKHQPLFIECQRKYLRPIFLSNRSRDLPRAVDAWGWQKTKRAQQKHNFPRWRSEECSRNEWSFPSVPLALFSSSDRMFVFRKIDRNETPRPLLARECSARIDEVETSDIFFFFRYCYRDIFDGCSNALAGVYYFYLIKQFARVHVQDHRGFAQISRE
jgi:hypothetical protein